MNSNQEAGKMVEKLTKAQRSVEPRKVHNGGHSTDGVDPKKVEALARRIIRPMRERAKLIGYAIAVHGSLARDIDLIAAPWTEDAYAPDALASHMRQVLEKLYPITLEVLPNLDSPKPHGRLCWSWWIRPWTYVDLSVMPPTGAALNSINQEGKGEP